MRPILAIVLSACLTLTGCPTPQQWFQIAGALIPIVLQTVTAFQIGTNPLTAADQANLQNYAKSATTILNDIGADISIANSNVNVSLIQKIDAEIASLKTQTAGILGALQVKDATELAKITAWVNAILADAQDLANLIPIIQGIAGGTTPSVTRAQGTVVIKMRTSLPKAKSLQDVFNSRLAAVKAAN